jgi:Arc/MetJ-type ribon-helix-helix transcriptional regulator
MAEHAVQRDSEPYAGGMDAPRAKRVRVTVRLSPERLERARKAVKRGRAASISAWVEEALRKHDSNFGWDENWREYFDELEREFGPPSEETRAWARRVVYGP